jgi:hypothetical protein
VFAKRKQKRMRKSGKCLRDFWCKGKHTFIINVTITFEEFRVRYNEVEFPILGDRTQATRNVVAQCRLLRGRPNCAAVVGAQQGSK